MTEFNQVPSHALTDEEKDNLVKFFEILIEIDQEEKAREHRLQDEPKGFSIQAEGRGCHGCGRSYCEGDMWYNKWGLKCMNCQDALHKKVIPGYIFKDTKNDKFVNLSSLSFKSGLHQMTIKKLVRQGKLKARIYKGKQDELWVFLRKENPDIAAVLEAEIENQKK